MKVFIANFGRENYEWPECRRQGTVATMNAVPAFELWQAGDRDGYIAGRMKETTWAGRKPTLPLAARWYNLMTIISETEGDLWIHRDGDRLWWTTSTNAPPTFEHKVEPVGGGREVVVCHKPCQPWSDRAGSTLLAWAALHPKARDFLATEATLQELSADNAAYALALVEGRDRSAWHSRPEWRNALEQAQRRGKGHSEVRIASPQKMAAARMAAQAFATVAVANGQQVLKTIKVKEADFASKYELEEFIEELLREQEERCALTDLPLGFDRRCEDKQMLASLDRIDSSGHYERGNLQVVCRFINRWKGADADPEARRLLNVLRDHWGAQAVYPGLLVSAHMQGPLA